MKRKRKNRKIADIIRLVILLVALSVLLYPTISNYLYEKNSSRIVSDYDATMEQISEEERQAMLAKAREYNEKLAENPAIMSDPFLGTAEEDPEYQSLLNMNGAGVMGYIRIPKIELELPVYHGTSEKVLQRGIGHISTSSLPIGGATTHAVLTGHRGLPSKLLFTDLDKMEMGDIFYLKILNETLAYQVDQILTVLPEETESLKIVNGEDYVTLVTCTPYAVNTHRLLVRGTRIPYEEAIEQVPDEKITPELPFQVKLLILAIIILIMIFVFYLIGKKMRKKRKGRKERK